MATPEEKTETPAVVTEETLLDFFSFLEENGATFENLHELTERFTQERFTQEAPENGE